MRGSVRGGRVTGRPTVIDRELQIKHLSIVGRETTIIIRLPRYQCLNCPKKPTTTQQVAWRERKSAHTRAYEKHLLLELIGSTVEEVSIREGIGYEAVMGIVRRHIRDERVTFIFAEIGLDIFGADYAREGTELLRWHQFQ